MKRAPTAGAAVRAWAGPPPKLFVFFELRATDLQRAAGKSLPCLAGPSGC